MKKINKKLITEINDMREMMRKIENTNDNKQRLDEQPDPCALAAWNSCHPDCTCIPILGFSNVATAGEDYDCCCGNEIPTIDGCQPGPCGGNSDCGGLGSGMSCCYADSGMAQLQYPSCNVTADCHSYPSGMGPNPNNPPGNNTGNTGTQPGCTDPDAYNYQANANPGNPMANYCCYITNSGCKAPQFGGNPQLDCDCDFNWVLAGFGDVSCCSGGAMGDGTTYGQSGSSGTDWSGGFSTGGSACFVDGSLVIMSNGEEKNISQIEIGEMVKSEIGNSKVIGIDIHKGEFEIHSFNGGRFFTTSEHPFKTEEGWKALNPIKAMKEHGVQTNILKEGDVLTRIDGKVELKTVTKDEEKHNVVYNLRLDNEHVYYVDGYLVHNAKDGEGGTGNVGIKGDKFRDDTYTDYDGDGIGDNPGGLPGGKPLPDAKPLRNKRG